MMSFVDGIRTLTSQVPSHYSFALQYLAFANQHCAAFQIFSVCFAPFLYSGRHLIQVVRYQVIWQYA